MGYISRGIDGVRDGYALVVRKLLRFSVLGVVLVVAFGLGVGGLARVTPTSFLPEEDQAPFSCRCSCRTVSPSRAPARSSDRSKLS
jgi:Cation/multidrug efflux pump